MIHKAVQDFLVLSNNENSEKRLRTRGVSNNLWPSDLGYCHRKAILRSRGQEGELEFSPRSLGYMRTGVVLEDDTGEALKRIFGDDIDDQLQLSMPPWSGRPDFVIYHGTDKPILVEHKVTGEKAWWREGIIPKLPHLGQITTYGVMYEYMYGVFPELILYYRGWGHYAELKLDIGNGKVTVEGFIDDAPFMRVVDYDPLAEIKQLQSWYNNGDLPPKLKYKKDGCTWYGKPNCPYYDYCYG